MAYNPLEERGFGGKFGHGVGVKKGKPEPTFKLPTLVKSSQASRPQPPVEEPKKLEDHSTVGLLRLAGHHGLTHEQASKLVQHLGKEEPAYSTLHIQVNNGRRGESVPEPHEPGRLKDLITKFKGEEKEEPKLEAKTEKPEEKEEGKLEDHSAVSLIRLAGHYKLDREQTRQVLDHLGKTPSDATIKTQLYQGRVGNNIPEPAEKSRWEQIIEKVRNNGNGENNGPGGEGIGAKAKAAGGSVAGEAQGSGGTKGDAARGSVSDQSAGYRPAKTVPAEVGEVNKKIDRFTNLFRSKGQHQVADWMEKLKAHVNTVGVDSALDALGPDRGPGDDTYQYQGARNMGDFVEGYLNRAGISIVGDRQIGQDIYGGDARDPDQKVIGSNKYDPKSLEGGRKAGDFFPIHPVALKNKLEEAQHLPGLEKSEALPEGTTHLTPEVMSGLDDKFGKGKWIVKAFGDEAAAGYGIFFPQRAQQIQNDARNTIYSAAQELSKYGFSLRRDDDGVVTGIQHTSGDTYGFKSKKYQDKIYGDVRQWGDKAMAASQDEKGASLPDGGKDFMVQPAFDVVGVSEADRAAGRTIAPGEGRVHVVTRNGKAEVIPHSTWIKFSDLPVVFEDENTRAMAKAAQDAIDALPDSEKQGQIYAPDIVNTTQGFRVVEANPTNNTGGSGYLGDQNFVVDSYVSHLTDRSPAHVRFIRNLLTTRRRKG